MQTKLKERNRIIVINTKIEIQNIYPIQTLLVLRSLLYFANLNVSNYSMPGLKTRFKKQFQIIRPFTEIDALIRNVYSLYPQKSIIFFLLYLTLALSVCLIKILNPHILTNIKSDIKPKF